MICPNCRFPNTPETLYKFGCQECGHTIDEANADEAADNRRRDLELMKEE